MDEELKPRLNINVSSPLKTLNSGAFVPSYDKEIKIIEHSKIHNSDINYLNSIKLRSGNENSLVINDVILEDKTSIKPVIEAMDAVIDENKKLDSSVAPIHPVRKRRRLPKRITKKKKKPSRPPISPCVPQSSSTNPRYSLRKEKILKCPPCGLENFGKTVMLEVSEAVASSYPLSIQRVIGERSLKLETSKKYPKKSHSEISDTGIGSFQIELCDENSLNSPRNEDVMEIENEGDDETDFDADAVFEEAENLLTEDMSQSAFREEVEYRRPSAMKGSSGFKGVRSSTPDPDCRSSDKDYGSGKLEEDGQIEFVRKLKSALKTAICEGEIIESDNSNATSSSKKSRRKRTPKKRKTVTFKDESELDTIPEDIQEIGEDMERGLEEKAEKARLTATNVKNMLKAVLTNSEVLKLVDYTMQKSDEKPAYELKLTRAKTKELAGLESNPLFSRPVGPTKNPEIETLIREELPEDESDEEYVPHQDLSEDEESNKANESGLIEEDEEVDLNATVASVPGEDASIGQRTRSKLCLSETPLEAIEQAFVPPDITTDMYNTDCDNEDWANFLKEFMLPLDPSSLAENNDDENDPEYNVMVDEESDATDKEELRADKAVKVTKKEFNDLMNEIIEYTDMLSSDEEDGHRDPLSDPLQPPQESVPEVPVEETETTPTTEMSVAQYYTIVQQLRQHVQLLTQSCLLVYGLPHLYSYYYTEPRKLLEELNALRKIKNDGKSTYNILNLDSSLKLVQEWVSVVDESSEIKDYLNRQLEIVMVEKRKRQRHRPELPEKLIELCLESDAFLYPLLLPEAGYTEFVPGRQTISPIEDLLLVIGLEEFSVSFQLDIHNPKDLRQVTAYVQKLLIPTKTLKNLLYHIRKSLKSDSENIIKQFFNTKKAPVLKHFVVLSQSLTKLCEYPLTNLSEKWQEYLKSFYDF